jgi:hypothetical protein
MTKVLVIGAIGAVAIVARKVVALVRDRVSDPQPEPVRGRGSAPETA